MGLLWPGRLRNQIMLVTILPITLIFAALLAWQLVEGRQQAEAEAYTRLLRKAEESSQRLNSQLFRLTQDARQVASGVADTADVRSDDLYERLRQQLSHADDLLYGLTVVFVPDTASTLPAPSVHRTKGRLQVEDLSVQGLDYSARQLEWYRQVLDSGRPRWMPPSFEREPDARMMVTYAHPVLRKGKLLAVVAASIDLSELALPMGLQPDEFMLVTAAGQYIYHPDSLRVMNENLRSDPAFTDDLPLVTAVLDSRSGLHVQQTLVDEPLWLAHVPVTLPDWRLLVTLPEARVYQQVDQQARVTVYFYVLLTLLIGLGVFVAVSRVARPLESLRKAVDALSDGNWSIEIPACGSSEVQGLASTLRNMADELRQRQESILDARGERFAALLEGLGHNFFYIQLGPAGEVLQVTASVERVLGYRQDEFRRRYSRLFTADPLNDANLSHTEQAIRGESSPLHLVEMRHADGSPHRLQMALRPIMASDCQVLAVEALVTDVTELTSAAEWFRTLLEATPDAMVIVDGFGRIEYINHQVLDLFGYAAEILMGKPVLELLSEQQTPAAMAQLETALADPVRAERLSGLELEGRRGNGSLFPMEVSWASPPARNDDEIQLLIAMRDISDKKQASQQIERAKLRLQDIADSIPGAVFQLQRSPEGELAINFLSNGVFQTHGLRREVIMGQPLLLLNNVVPEHRARLLSCFHATEDNEEFCAIKLVDDAPIMNEEVMISHPDGRQLWLQCNALVRNLEDGSRVWNGYWVDITHHKRLAEELRRSETFFRTVFDQADVGIISADARGNILRANAAFERFIGMDEARLQHLNMLELTDPDDQPETTRLMRQVQRGERDHFQQEKRFVRADGDARWGQQRFTAVRNARGERSESLIIIQDVTEQRAIGQALAEAKQVADQASRAKSEFLANMSHEIRTPMNAIIGMTHLCLQTRLDDQQRNFLGKIDNSARILLGIINDVLDFSKIEAGKLELENIEFDLEEILSRLSDLFTWRAGEKGVELVFCVEPDVPVRLLGDSLRISQILMNFLSNAIKFTEKGEIVLSARLQSRQNGRLVLYFSVRDSGMGISPEQQQRLFKSFSQADGSTTRRFGGTGLGLAICKQLVELMDGEIGVSSEPGKGSTFYFTACLDDLPGSQGVNGDELFELHGLPVLVVDDNDTTRDSLRDILQAFEFRVLLASSGEQALAVLAQQSTPVRLILMDWRMPGMDGVETARRIAQHPGSEAPVIIMVSAFDHSQVQESAAAAGIQHFLPKPLSPSLLLDAILRALGKSVRRHASIQGGFVLDERQRQRLAGQKILLVEDNDINQEVAEGLLAELGLQVTLADDGRMGVDKALRGTFDLILMDCQMPVMDGYAATREIRERLGEAAPPIIAMTANVQARDREDCVAAGMVDHVAKPIDVPELHRTLWRWLGDGSGSALPGASLEPEPDGPHWPALPWIDARRGLALSGQHPERYRHLLNRFTERQTAMRESLQAAMMRQDNAEAERGAHTLKGLAGAIGANRLQALAATLEKAVHAQLSTEASEALLLLLEEDDAVQMVLQGWQASLPKPAATEAEPVNHDPALQQQLLDELKALLEDDDGQAVAVTLRLCREASFGLDAQILLQLERAVEQYDFCAARALMERLVDAGGQEPALKI